MSNIKRAYWEIIDCGEIYPDPCPKKNRVGAKCELIADIEQIPNS